jgi:Rod binding domain-containing protein
MTDYMLPINSPVDIANLAKTSQMSKQKDNKLGKTASEFEAMLMTQLFQTLRKTVEPSGLFGDNQTERNIYEYLFDQSIFQNAAANGQTWGLASKLEEQWKNFQLQNDIDINNS